MPPPSADPPGAAATAWSRARDLVRLRPGRFPWADATRAAGCVGGTVLIGWWVGDVEAGLIASIGAFTSLYGTGRPYPYRARQLALIAVAFALVVTLGGLSVAVPWTSAFVVAAIAMAATWLCRALDTGPPGAYLFVLACAMATSVSGSGPPWRTGVLVLAGGVLSWLVHMAGALVRPHGPETAAVSAGATAVVRLLEADGAGYVHARDEAARAMHHCWVHLAGNRTRPTDPADPVVRLRAIALRLHGLLAETMRAHDEGRPVRSDSLARARDLAAQVADPPPAPGPLGRDDLPWGGLGPLRSARQVLAAGSPWRVVVVRVGVAALVAGAAGSTLGLEHAYWSTAAAVLVLHQGLGWAGTAERAVQRLVGTWVGLLLAGAVLAMQLAGVALVLTITALQFVVQLTVPRNYGLGVVFVTPLALTIGSAGHPPDLGALLLSRGIDTLVGCVIGVLAYLLVAPGPAVPQPRRAVVDTMRAVLRVLPHVADGSTAGGPGREARAELDRLALSLPEVYDSGSDALTARRRSLVTRWWPALAAAQHVAYRTLSACWRVDAAAPADRAAVAASLVPAGQADRLAGEVGGLADALEQAVPPPPATRRTEGTFLDPELDALQEAVPRASP
ncbi:FUSC family protein [Pseudonocardia yuanmonensis]|uniref:FUSC family protein n=1 Tax=Pseudonocardia yuanmonensis TaxID=1095914 RepID=UPI0031EDFBF3